MSMTPKSRYVLDGIVPILQTPFHEGGTLDGDSLRRLVDHVIQAGAVGVICPAVASEVHKLTPDERRAMVEIALDQARGRVPVFVGVSAESAEESLALARHAATHGAAGILAQAPEAIGADGGQLRAYFRTLARGVDLPLMIQISIQFFKRVLVAKGIFRTHVVREPILRLDGVQERIAAGLVDRVLAMERDLA